MRDAEKGERAKKKRQIDQMVIDLKVAREG